MRSHLQDPASTRNFMVARMAVDQAGRKHPWYDSPWLVSYLAAKTLIARIRPSLLADFEAAFAPLRTRKDFEVVALPALLDDAQLAAIRQSIRDLPADVVRTNETDRFGRTLARNQPAHIELQRLLTPLVSEVVGEAVEPSYNFLSLYTEFGVCEPHMDAPNAKWTLDVCIEQSKSWPIHFSQIVDWPEDFRVGPDDDWRSTITTDPALTFRSHELNPGQAVVFSGSSQWHYRNPLPDAQPSDYCNLLFLHFLPKGMGEVVKPRNWPTLFDMPELEWVVGPPKG